METKCDKGLNEEEFAYVKNLIGSLKKITQRFKKVELYLTKIKDNYRKEKGEKNE